MNDIGLLIVAATVLAVSVSAYYRSRYWAREAEQSAKEANLAYHRAHDSAMEAEENANRAENA